MKESVEKVDKSLFDEIIGGCGVLSFACHIVTRNLFG
jgi:hypothetical protein